MRVGPSLLLVPALVLPLAGQALTDRFKDAYKIWDVALERGEGATVRRATEALLSREGLAVSASDYNNMRALVATEDYAARACILEGAWEDALGHLQKAAASANENLKASEITFGRIRKDHETKVAEWKAMVEKQDKRLKEIEGQAGWTAEQIGLRNQLRSFLEEHRAAIAHSEWSLKEIDALLAQLAKEQATYAASLTSWQEFMAKEKQEIAQAGSPSKYVADKFEQVKADEARPRYDRLSYSRRLLRMEPENADLKRFVSGLMGGSDETEKPKTAPRKKKAPTKKR